MDRLLKCLALLVVFLCCCLHSRAQQKGRRPKTGWGAWGPWSQCSISCGYGFQTRVRNWHYAPEDTYQKTFTNTDTMECTKQACPVNGTWSMWGIWKECSAACGGGLRKRRRDCNNPAPQYGGKNCTGKGIEEESCKPEPCPPTPDLFDMRQCRKRFNFTCSNKRMCIPKRQRCDDTVQCSDGSDEIGCRQRYKIGRVHFSNAATHHSTSSFVAVLIALASSWFVKLFIGEQRHTLHQSAPRP